MTEHETLSQLTALIKQELQAPNVNVAVVSIALGAIETPLTKKDPAQQLWPANLTVKLLKTISRRSPTCLISNRQALISIDNSCHSLLPQDEVAECSEIFENFVATINSQLAPKHLDLRVSQPYMPFLL